MILGVSLVLIRLLPAKLLKMIFSTRCLQTKIILQINFTLEIPFGMANLFMNILYL